MQREVLHHGRGCSEASPIALPSKVTPEILALLLTYCRFHRASGRSDKVPCASGLAAVSMRL